MTFAELVALLVLGSGEPDSLVGVVRHHSPEDESWTHRLWRRGELMRRESLDGRVLLIRGAQRSWYREQHTNELVVRPNQRQAGPIGGLEPGAGRPSFSRWDGTDFTRPTGPVIATTFLGRDCWQVELAPPAHKPFPLTLTVDAATGLVVRDVNAQFGSATEFVELEIGAELPDELFEWDGPASAPPDRRAEHEADLAERRAWLDARGIVLDLPVRPEPMLHDRNDETGAFDLAVHTVVEGSLVRRPVDDPPAEDVLRYPHTYRWTDARWAWVLGTMTPIADEPLALLKVQLATST